MIKNLDNLAFSLLEVLLASIIFVVSVGGIFVTLNAVRKPVTDKENALAAAVFGKQVLEALRSQVNAATFYGSCSSIVNGACVDFSLYLGLHQVPSNAPTLPSSWLVQSPWPSVLTTTNNFCNPAPCLVYTVSCADNTSDISSCASGGANPDMARQVNLSINWPDTI